MPYQSALYHPVSSGVDVYYLMDRANWVLQLRKLFCIIITKLHFKNIFNVYRFLKYGIILVNRNIYAISIK